MPYTRKNYVKSFFVYFEPHLKTGRNIRGKLFNFDIIVLRWLITLAIILKRFPVLTDFIVPSAKHLESNISCFLEALPLAWILSQEAARIMCLRQLYDDGMINQRAFSLAFKWD